MCFRALRNSDDDDRNKNPEKFWIQAANLKLVKTKERALKCLRDIISYFPEIDKMSKFMHKYDEFLESDSCGENLEFKKTIQMNKILMKILVDIELSAKILFNDGLKKTYKMVKFAIDLHKSI